MSNILIYSLFLIFLVPARSLAASPMEDFLARLRLGQLADAERILDAHSAIDFHLQDLPIDVLFHHYLKMTERSELERARRILNKLIQEHRAAPLPLGPGLGVPINRKKVAVIDKVLAAWKDAIERNDRVAHRRLLAFFEKFWSEYGFERELRALVDMGSDELKERHPLVFAVHHRLAPMIDYFLSYYDSYDLGSIRREPFLEAIAHAVAWGGRANTSKNKEKN